MLDRATVWSSNQMKTPIHTKPLYTLTRPQQTNTLYRKYSHTWTYASGTNISQRQLNAELQLQND